MLVNRLLSAKESDKLNKAPFPQVLRSNLPFPQVHSQ